MHSKMILRINSFDCLKRHYVTVLCNADMLCFIWGRNLISKYYLDGLRTLVYFYRKWQSQRCEQIYCFSDKLKLFFVCWLVVITNPDGNATDNLDKDFLYFPLSSNSKIIPKLKKSTLYFPCRPPDLNTWKLSLVM